MYQFLFTSYALKQFKKLPIHTQSRIKQKLLYWEKNINPLGFSKPLFNFGKSTHRFRIGDYRVICRVEKHAFIILILKVGHRSKIYE